MAVKQLRTLDPYKEDHNYLRWLTESCYGHLIKLRRISRVPSRTLFPPLFCCKMPYYHRLSALMKLYFDRKLHSRLLDCGCGIGALSFSAAEMGYQVTAIDTSPIFIDFCLMLRGRPGPFEVELPGLGSFVRKAKLFVPSFFRDSQIEFLLGDALQMGFQDESFDFIVSSNVLDRVADPTLAVSEIYRSLRPGGRLIVSSPLDWSLIYTPNVSCWFDSLITVFSKKHWKILHEETALQYQVRISDRFVEEYLCQVLVAEKRTK